MLVNNNKDKTVRLSDHYRVKPKLKLKGFQIITTCIKVHETTRDI